MKKKINMEMPEERMELPEEIRQELKELNQELKERLDTVELLVGNDSRRLRKKQKSQTGSSVLEKKRKRKKKLLIGSILLFLFVLLIAAAGVALFVMRWMGQKSLVSHEGIENVEITAPEEVVVEEKGQVVTYKGTAYERNENIISILCMGIDKRELAEEEQVAGEGGQADTIFVVALDSETGGIRLVNISRDSMAAVDVYNIDNEYAGTEIMQLCLAYAYGDGKKTSCENVIKSVSKLLYGMPIDAYAAIDMSAIRVLNDAIGGVEVELLEDFTEYDPSMTKGNTVVLKGEMARAYVRKRQSEKLDSNNDRIARQKQYLTNFVTKAISHTREDITVPLNLYEAVTPYMVTDINMSEVTYLASLVLKGNLGLQDIINIPGETIKGEVYAEYHIDEEALYEIILDVFYQPVDKE